MDLPQKYVGEVLCHIAGHADLAIGAREKSLTGRTDFFLRLNKEFDFIDFGPSVKKGA